MAAPTSWLPPPTAAAATSGDTPTWERLVAAFASGWAASAALPLPDRALATLPWVTLFNNWRHVLDRRAVSPQAARTAVETMLSIAVALPPSLALAPHTRWLGLAAAHLRALRFKLDAAGFVVDWRVVQGLVDAAGGLSAPPPAFDGPVVVGQLKEAALRLARAARRFYPPGAAAEVWAAAEAGLRPDRTPEAAGFEALGWLALLFPARAVASPHPLDAAHPWGAMAAGWLGACVDGVQGCAWWDGLWLGLFARLAKHDAGGAVDWAALAPRLTSRLAQPAVPVPVGTASADPPYGRPPPPKVGALFGCEGAWSRPDRAAKLLVSLAGSGGGRSGGPPEDGGARAEGGTARAVRLLALLDQYAHPSNTGRWSPALGDLLAGLAKHLGKRLTREAVAAAAGARAAEHDAHGDAGQRATTAPSARPPGPHAPTPPLTASDAAILGGAIARVAGSAMFSKDGRLASAAGQALGEVAFLAPAAAIPLVCHRFETALASLAAAHRLGAATDALAACVRPLLVLGLPEGWAAADAEGEGMEAEAEEEGGEASLLYRGSPATGAAFLAAACDALLPALDPSDPVKTLAALRLMAAALSSGGIAPDPGEEEGTGNGEAAGHSFFTLPPGFLGGLLDRTFALLTALDNTGDDGGGPSGGGGGDGGGGNGGGVGGGGGSFLLGGDSFLRPVLELAFARAPPSARARGLRAVSKFATARAMPSVAAEAALVCNAAAWADPDRAARELLPPLLAAVEAHLPPRGGAWPTARLSKAAEAGLCWALALLAASLYRAGPAGAAPANAPRLRAALVSAAAAPSHPAQDLAARAISSTLAGLVAYYPSCDSQCGPVVAGGGEGGTADPFFDHVSATASTPPPAWHTPSDAELALAAALVDDHLTAAAAAVAGAGGGDREAVRGALVRAEAVLLGARASLPEFEFAGGGGAAGGGAAEAPPGDALAGLGIQGEASAPLGDAGPREALGAALAGLLLPPSTAAPPPTPAPDAPPADPGTLALAARAAGAALSRGSAEYGEAQGAYGAWSGDAAALGEPRLARWAEVVAAAGGVAGARGGGRGGGAAPAPPADPKAAFRRRRPRWLVVERAYADSLWRAGQAAWRPPGWGAGVPALPPGWRALAAALLACAGGPYAGVRSAAVCALEGALKRAPAAAPAALPGALAALARLPPRPPGEVRALLGLGGAAGAVAAPLPPPSFFADGDAGAGVPADLLAALAAAISSPAAPAAPAAGPPAAGPAATPLTASEEEGRVMGGAGLLRTQALWRLACRRPAAAAATAAATVAASLGNDNGTAAAAGALLSPRTAQAAFDAWASHVMRFVRPPGVAGAAASGDGGATMPASVRALVDALAAAERAGDAAAVAAAAGATAATPPGHWRASLVVCGTALLFLPPPDAGAARAAAATAVAALTSPFAARRAVGCAALALLCPRAGAGGGGDEGWTTGAGRGGAAEGVVAAVTALASTFGSSVLDGFAAAHPQDGEGGRGGGGGGAAAAMARALLGGGGGGGGGGALDERAAELLARSVERGGAIPWLRAGEPAPAGVAGGWFSGRAAMAVEALARAGGAGGTGGGAVPDALRGAVTAAAASAKAQEADRPRAAAAAEVLAGLTASGAVFAAVASGGGGGGGGAWGEWVSGAWRAGLACPPALTPAWAAAIRFAIAGLVGPGGGAPDAAAALAAFLAAVDGAGGAGAGAAEAARGLALSAAVAAELGAVGAWAGGGEGAACATSPFTRPPAPAPVRAVAAAWGLAALARARAAAAARSDAVRGAAAALLALLAGPALAPSPPPSSSPSCLASAAADAIAVTVREAEGAAAWFGAHRQGGGGGGAGGAGVQQQQQQQADAASAALDFAASLVEATLSARGGASTASLATPLLLPLLPPLARAVDLGTAWPGLDGIAGAAARAVAGLKYVQWPAGPGGELPALRAAAGLVVEDDGSPASLMATRAAGLAAAGALWFRWALSLGDGPVGGLVGAAEGALGDSKRPVADLAAGTLAGLLRGVRPDQAAGVRARLLAAAAATRPPPQKKQKQPAPPTPTTRASRLRAVLGLRALIAAAPYDVPPWLPDALLATAAAAGEGEPTGGAARAALAEFRRTHEAAGGGGGGAGGRPAGLTEGQWAAVRDVGAGGGSYFV